MKRFASLFAVLAATTLLCVHMSQADEAGGGTAAPPLPADPRFVPGGTNRPSPAPNVVPRTPTYDPQFVPRSTPAEPSPYAPSLRVTPADRALQQARQAFLDLAAKRAQQLTKEELEQAAAEIQREVKEYESAAKLAEIVKALEQLSKQHAHTKAAEAARRGIDAITEEPRQTLKPAVTYGGIR